MNEMEALEKVYSAVKRGVGIGTSDNATELEQLSEDLLPIWRRQTETVRSSSNYGALLPFHYVISNQDLKLVETVTSIVTTASSVGFLLPELGYDPAKGLTAAMVGIVVAIVKVLHNLQLSVHLDETDYAIVARLSCAGHTGLTVQELCDALNPKVPITSVDSLSKRLDSLTNCATVKGTRTALVWKDASERWLVNGV